MRRAIARGTSRDVAIVLAVKVHVTYQAIAAPMKPMPGMVSSRWLASFDRCCAMIRFSSDPISVNFRLGRRRRRR